MNKKKSILESNVLYTIIAIIAGFLIGAIFLMIADILFLWAASVPLGALAGLVWHLPAFWIYTLLKIDQIIKAVWCVFRLSSKKWIKRIDSHQ